MWMLIVVLVMWIFIGVIVTQKAAELEKESIIGGDALGFIVFWPIVVWFLVVDHMDWEDTFSFLHFEPKV